MVRGVKIILRSFNLLFFWRMVFTIMIDIIALMLYGILIISAIIAPYFCSPILFVPGSSFGLNLVILIHFLIFNKNDSNCILFGIRLGRFLQFFDAKTRFFFYRNFNQFQPKSKKLLTYFQPKKFNHRVQYLVNPVE